MPAHKSASQSFTPAARVLRGEGVEALHAAAIAVVDRESRLTHALGDPEQVFFSRSAIKPLQVLPLVRAGGLERFGFGSEELALCAASHNGSDEHRAVVARMLDKLELEASALQCGATLPLQLRLFHQHPTQGEDQDVLRHNCSGKHCGFLALAKLLDQPVESYLDPEGPAQRLVRSAVAEACELDAAALLLGTDGCSAPNFALPLRHLAIGLKNLALASGTAETAAAALKVRQAMLAHPRLVSGERRLDYDLARAFPERVVAKGGAEAILLVAFAEPALGIAIKVLDGSARALGPILVECLKQLGLIDAMSRFPTLQRYEVPSITNARKLKTGEIVADFQLSRF
jgi:L-asparaginase II